MFDSKLLETVRVMTSEEISDFIQSPFYNDRRVRKEVVQLFEHIIVDHPACSRSELSKEAAHRCLFGDKPFVENRLHHVMTALQRLLESYLSTQYAHHHPELEQLFALARFFQRKELAHRFEATVARIQELLQNIADEDERVLWSKYQLEYLKHHQSGALNPRNSDLNLPPVLNSLDNFFITQRLIISSGLLTQRHFVKMDTSHAMVWYDYISKLEQFASEIATNPLAQGYYKLLPLLKDEAGLQDVIEFRAYLLANKNRLPAAHLKNLYKGIRSYLANGYNRGENEMLPLLFSNQKDEFEQGFLFEDNGMIRASTYQNVVTTGLKLGQYEWVRQFMDQCQHKITGSSDPENELIFNEANYFFHTGRFDAAMDTGFHLLRYENFAFNLPVRRLEIKIWYEKNDLEMTEYRLNALKSYLYSNRNNIPDQMLRNNNDFVDVLRQLISPRNRESAKRLQTLREKLHDERRSVADREWFLQKMDKMLPG